MRRRTSAALAAKAANTVDRELEAARRELDERRRRDDRRKRLDAVSEALIGLLDREEVLAQAARLATAALGRPCTIDVTRPAGTDAIALGSAPVTAWMTIGGTSAGPEDDLDVATVAKRIGLALDATRRLDAQADTIKTLERSLLPEALLPVPGLQLASRFLPAPGAHDVGGDFYDAIVRDCGVTLIVGDVQGKGIEAATLTSLTRHTLRASALAGAPPGEMLAHLNRALLYGQQEQLTAGRDPVLRFVTAAVAHVEPSVSDPSTFAVAVARAGQPPPIVVRSDGAYEVLEPRGVLLGVCDDPAYEEQITSLGVGDALVLYTDGVIEQRGGEGKAMTEQHLGMLVRNRRGVTDAEAIAQLIEDTVRLVAPENIRDDVAILVACPTREASERV